MCYFVQVKLHFFFLLQRCWLFLFFANNEIRNSDNIEHVYVRPKVNSNRFEISNRFEKLFHLHNSFPAANLETSNPSQKLFPLNSGFTVATF